jgi:hypothetical protein
MITSKKYTCCFRPPTTEEKQKYDQKHLFLMLKAPKDKLRDSVCDKCWQSIISNICQKDTVFTRLNNKLKYHFKYIPRDIINLIAVDTFQRVILKSATLHANPIEMVNGYMIPLGILAFFYKSAVRLTINYLKSPKAKMLSKFREISETFDQHGELIRDYIDEKQLSPERLVEISKSLHILRATIKQIQADLKPLHKPIKEKIIDLSALELLAPREILVTLKTEEKYSVLIPVGKDDQQLLKLINNTISQFRKNIRAKLPNFSI